MIVVFGSTGNTGRATAEALVAHGKNVRAVARHRDRLEPLAAIGAEPWTADLEHAETVKRALQGAKATYLLIPPNFAVDDVTAYQHRVIENLLEGLRQSEVESVVVLSSLGANHAQGTGPIVGLHRLEEGLRGMRRLNALFIRAGFFMENFFASLQPIRSEGVHASAAPADAPLELIATVDIGSYAAERLGRLDFSGKRVVNLVAPRAYTMGEVTAVLGRAIGRPDLPYVERDPAELERAMRSTGVRPQLAALYGEMYRAVREGLLAPEPGTEMVRSHTPLEAFKPAFAAAYRGLAAA